MLHRFLPLIGARQGAIDWCIRVDDIRDAVRRLRDAGIEMVDEMEFDRERPDGKVARWLLAGPRDVRLPFLIEDLTPVEIRVPFRDLCTHPNGVTAIRRLVLPHEAKTAFERALGPVLRAEPGSTTDESAPLGSVTVEGSRQRRCPRGRTDSSSFGQAARTRSSIQTRRSARRSSSWGCRAARRDSRRDGVEMPTPSWSGLVLFPRGVAMPPKLCSVRPGFSKAGASFPALTPSTLATERQRSCHSGCGRFGCFAVNAPAVGRGDSSPASVRELPSTAHKKRRTP